MIKGSHCTEETRKKMSNAKIGENNPNYGKPAWNKGKPFSKEARKNMSEAHKGKHLSEEIKRKISEGNKGKISCWRGCLLSNEHKENIGKANKGKVRSQEFKDKLSITRRGENGPGWKGGITPLHKNIRYNCKMKEWRLMVFGRDNFTCQDCGIRGCYLEAHHIKSFSSILQYYEITTLEEALDCEELWNINNGITLCKKCHKKLRGDNNGCN